MNERPNETSLLLMEPPYEVFTPLPVSWRRTPVPPKGTALVWNTGLTEDAARDYDVVRHRPFGVPVFVLLPEPDAIHAILPLLSALPALRIRALLPYNRLTDISSLRRLLAEPPRHLGTTVANYLTWRGLIPAPLYSDLVTLFQCTRDMRSVSHLAQRLYVSRRTLGRRFAEFGIPVPSHWLQFSRLVHAAIMLQAEQASVFRTAVQLGYPDGFTLSNQMFRLLDVRPTAVRKHLGWEWVVESWICTEVRRSGFDPRRYRKQMLPYLRDGDATSGIR